MPTYRCTAIDTVMVTKTYDFEAANDEEALAIAREMVNNGAYDACAQVDDEETTNSDKYVIPMEAAGDSSRWMRV